jgi:glycine cleavage system H protein
MRRKNGYADRADLLLVGGDLWFGPIGEDSARRMGLTARSPALLGTPKFVSFDPVIGSTLSAGQTLMRVEADKWVGRIDMPFDCKVTAMNERLVEDPQLLKDDPYIDGWVAEVIAAEEAVEGLLKGGCARMGVPSMLGRAEKKARGGLVRAEVVLDGKTLICVRLTGDFHMFPVESIEHVERSLFDANLDEKALARTITGTYEHHRIESPGVSPGEIAAVIVEAARAATRSRGDRIL